MQSIICGRGGQGVITLNLMIGNLATALGLKVISAETHGMAMRGGSVYTSLKIDNSFCPTIGEGSADLLLSMDINEVHRNLHFLSESGIVITDGVYTGHLPFRVISVPAKAAATEKFNSPIHASTILLGVVIRIFPDIFPQEKTAEIIKSNIKINYEAFMYGLRGD